MSTAPTPFPLGRLVEHDERSRGFAFEAPAKLPTYSKTWRRRAPIFNQTGSSCTGNALAGWIGTDSRGQADADDALAMRLYTWATNNDQWPGGMPEEDTGSSGLAVCKAGVKFGYLSGYRHAFSFDALLAALYTSAVIVGTVWRGDMFRPLESGYLKCTGQIEGAHEYLIRGVDPRKKHLLCDQTWGGSWGRKGRFWLHFGDMENLLAENGDCTVPIR